MTFSLLPPLIHPSHLISSNLHLHLNLKSDILIHITYFSYACTHSSSYFNSYNHHPYLHLHLHPQINFQLVEDCDRNGNPYIPYISTTFQENPRIPRVIPSIIPQIKRHRLTPRHLSPSTHLHPSHFSSTNKPINLQTSVHQHHPHHHQRCLELLLPSPNSPKSFVVASALLRPSQVPALN